MERYSKKSNIIAVTNDWNKSYVNMGEINNTTQCQAVESVTVAVTTAVVLRVVLAVVLTLLTITQRIDLHLSYTLLKQRWPVLFNSDNYQHEKYPPHPITHEWTPFLTLTDTLRGL